MAASISLLGNLVCMSGVPNGMPRLAQEVLAGGGTLGLAKAISKLRKVRTSLVSQLSPPETYVLAKRSALQQTHIRTMQELLEGDVLATNRGRRMSRSR